ncbi:MAG: orotidine-5'-phosphate decarboxylase [Chloroflexota bacterium]
MSAVPALSPLDRLRDRVATLRAPLCVGIDPHPDRLPAGFSPDASGVERFARGLLEAVSDHAAAVKLNVAFYEALGSAGWRALERIRADVPPEVFCILDGKRGDIGNSAERYAEGLLGHLAADAVTLSPYLGEDAVEPFLAYPGRVVYLLARTSNPSAAQLQDLATDGQPLFERVALWAAERWPDGRVGLVVGATAPAELERVRSLVPGLGFLVPGVGQQGGDLVAAVRHCHGIAAPGLVSISRGISEASAGSGWAAAARAAAKEARERMREAGATLAA